MGASNRNTTRAIVPQLRGDPTNTRRRNPNSAPPGDAATPLADRFAEGRRAGEGCSATFEAAEARQPFQRHPWASEPKLTAAWARFLAKVAANDNFACWLWLGGQSCGGGKSDAAPRYGSFWIAGTAVRAHIFAWIACGFLLPDDLTLDHTCRNTLCVNPAHLEPVTLIENNRRQDEARRVWRCAA